MAAPWYKHTYFPKLVPKIIKLKKLHPVRQCRARSQNTLKTFFCQLLVVDQLAMPQVVEDGAEVGGVSVDHIGSGVILWQKDTGSTR